MRLSARAIVVKNNEMLVMQRDKFGDQFYTLVGGGVDDGETPVEALHREVAEEASLVIANPRLVILENAGPKYGQQYVYLADYVSGEPRLAPDSEEFVSTAIGQNMYKPLWLPLDKLAEVVLRPTELQTVLQEGLTKGFPDQPIELTIHS